MKDVDTLNRVDLYILGKGTCVYGPKGGIVGKIKHSIARRISAILLSHCLELRDVFAILEHGSKCRFAWARSRPIKYSSFRIFYFFPFIALGPLTCSSF